jgi:hypothetical protein
MVSDLFFSALLLLGLLGLSIMRHAAVLCGARNVL